MVEASERELTPRGGWISAETERIAPLSPSEVGRVSRAVLGGTRLAGVDVPRIFLVLAKHRRLFAPWLAFASRLMPFGTLARRETEAIILRVAWNSRCRYEWAHHVELGLRAGLSASQIRDVARGPDAPGLTPARASLLRAADELHEERVVSAATWEALRTHHSEVACIEALLLIGHYEMLAGFLNSTGVKLEASIEHVLERVPAGDGGASSG